MEIDRINAKAEVIESARAFDAEQAKRAVQFEAQVAKAFGRTPRKLDPVSWEFIHNHLRPYLYSTSLPGRIMPELLFGPGYKTQPAYIPIERRYTMKGSE
jgi:hypothetical protein